MSTESDKRPPCDCDINLMCVECASLKRPRWLRLNERLVRRQRIASILNVLENLSELQAELDRLKREDEHDTEDFTGLIGNESANQLLEQNLEGAQQQETP